MFLQCQFLFIASSRKQYTRTIVINNNIDNQLARAPSIKFLPTNLNV